VDHTQGIGNDIIEISRIQRIIDRFGYKFLDKIFTKEEQRYCLKHRDSTRHFAGRFAAKEAIVKALGTGFQHGISWLDIEIRNTADGKPFVTLSPKLQNEWNHLHILVSISHSREYATAVALYTQL
jgi:holo-[acyl-carrier protein] synthase